MSDDPHIDDSPAFREMQRQNKQTPRERWLESQGIKCTCEGGERGHAITCPMFEKVPPRAGFRELELGSKNPHEDREPMTDAEAMLQAIDDREKMRVLLAKVGDCTDVPFIREMKRLYELEGERIEPGSFTSAPATWGQNPSALFWPKKMATSFS